MNSEPIQLRRRRGRPRKIPPSQYPAIMARRAAGELLREIASDYGVSPPTIWRIEQRIERAGPPAAERAA